MFNSLFYAKITLPQLWEVLIILYYLYAIFIGVFIAFPIGPVGLICVQRTIKKGMKIGYISAIGIITADLFYGFVVLLASSYIEEYISKDNIILNLVISILFLIIGIKLLNSKEHEIEDTFIHPTLSAFFMGLANPGTIFVYLGIFAFFPVKLGYSNLYYSIDILFCIFLGSNILWFLLTELITHAKKLLSIHRFFIIDRIIGGFISCTGLFALIKILFRLKG